MKKYLSVFFCFLLVSPSFANSQQEQESPPVNMDMSFSELERTGMTVDQFFDLLKHPQWYAHPRIFSWINELLERNDPAINTHLVQLLSNNRWLESPDENEVSNWMTTLVKRELADSTEVIAMFEEEPWRSYFSYIARDAFADMLNTGRNLRAAVGYVSFYFLNIGLNNHSDLRNRPRPLDWTVTILMNWEEQDSERQIITSSKVAEDNIQSDWKSLAFSSFANSQQSLPPANASVSFEELEQRGITVDRFFALLENPPLSFYPHIVPWINELLERHNPDLDLQLIQLLANNQWLLESFDREVSEWRATLVKREFADNTEVMAMFEEEPWKEHFSHIVRSAFTDIVENDRSLRVAVGYASTHFLTTGPDNQSKWMLNDRVFAWITTILTTWEGQDFAIPITEAFSAIDREERDHFSLGHTGIHQMAEFLLTRQVSPLSSRLNLLNLLNTLYLASGLKLDWIFKAIEENSTTEQPKTRSWDNRQILGTLLDKHFAYRNSSTIASPLSEDEVEATFLAIDRFLLNDNPPSNAITYLAKYLGFENPRVKKVVRQRLSRWPDQVRTRFSENITWLNSFHIPPSSHFRFPSWILREVQENTKADNYNPNTVDLLANLLAAFLSKSHVYELFPEQLLDIFSAVDSLLDNHGYSPYDDTPIHEDTHIANALTFLTRRVPVEPNKSFSTSIKDRMGQILERGNLPFDMVIQLLKHPEWREHPNAPDLLIKLAQQPVYTQRNQAVPYLFHFSWNGTEVESLLADPFWQNNSTLQRKLGRRFFVGPQRLVTLENVSVCTIPLLVRMNITPIERTVSRR